MFLQNRVLFFETYCCKIWALPDPFICIIVDIDYETFEKRIIPKPDDVKDVIRGALEENFIFSSLSFDEKEDFVAAMEDR